MAQNFQQMFGESHQSKSGSCGPRVDVLTAWMRCPSPLLKLGSRLVSLCHGYPSGNWGLLGGSGGEYIQKRHTLAAHQKMKATSCFDFLITQISNHSANWNVLQRDNLLTLFPRLWEQRIGCYAMSLQSCLTLCDPMEAPLSMGFCRQEYWSQLSWLSPGYLPDPGIEPMSHYVSCIDRQVLYH